MTLDVATSLVEVPVLDWYAWVSSFLNPYIPDVERKSYNATRNGLQDVTLIHCVALPPDAWIPSVGRDRERATLVLETESDPNLAVTRAINEYSVPMSMVSAGPDTVRATSDAPRQRAAATRRAIAPRQRAAPTRVACAHNRAHAPRSQHRTHPHSACRRLGACRRVSAAAS
jgi:hypothetical protein